MRCTTRPMTSTKKFYYYLLAPTSASASNYYLFFFCSSSPPPPTRKKRMLELESDREKASKCETLHSPKSQAADTKGNMNTIKQISSNIIKPCYINSIRRSCAQWQSKKKASLTSFVSVHQKQHSSTSEFSKILLMFLM